MSSHAVGRIYLKLISFIEVILLKRSEAASFWPAVPILLAVVAVVELTLSEDSPGRELLDEADFCGSYVDHLQAKNALLRLLLMDIFRRFPRHFRLLLWSDPNVLSNHL